jgi:hypothetical protein
MKAEISTADSSGVLLHPDPATQELLRLVAEQREQMELQRAEFDARLNVLEADNKRLRSAGNLQDQSAKRSVFQVSDDEPTSDPSSNRRRFLRNAAAVAAGAGILTAARAVPAAAVNGDAITVGGSFTGTSRTMISNITGTALHGSGAPNFTGIYGEAPSTSGVGVYGATGSGYGVIGYSDTGYALFAYGANPRIGIWPSTYSSAPTAGFFNTGDIIRDTNNQLWLCTATGIPGVWRRIGGAGSAGALSLLPTVVRAVYTGNGTGIAAGTFATNTSRVTANLVPSLGLAASVLTSEITGVVAAVTAYPPGTAGTFAASGYLGVAGNYTATPSMTFTQGESFHTSTVMSSLVNGTLTIAAFANPCEVTVDIIGYYR